MPSIFSKLLKHKASTPNTFDAIYAQATSAAEARDFGRAVQLYDQAIALDPAIAEAYYKRGNALKNLGRLESALASYDEAIARKADYAYAYCNRGVVQQSLGQTSAALASYDRAIATDPGDALTHYNRALLLQECFRWDEALAGYDDAISINPQFADALYNRALARLFQGDFESGWPGYEWRWKNAHRLAIGTPRNFTQPLWLGNEPIAGKRLLLYSEGGLGDTVQFCRYASLCASLGATVFLEVQPSLAGLLADLPGVSQVIAAGSPLPDFDCQCPLMSLPLAFKTTLATIPAAAKYLTADPARVAQWRTRLGKRHQPRIGLVWSGNPNNTIDARRSIRLADWVPHLPPEFTYFCLQRDVRPEDQTVLESASCIFSFDEENLDFVNTAALCECMDLVISVDTSLAHLSGALGLRTWLLLAYVPDWRWMRERIDTPWYPSTTLYRQKSPDDWPEVFGRIATDLRAGRQELAGNSV
jgi:hypothetical protein